MYSASDWGGGSWKSGHSKGGCVNFILQISSKCGQGGRWSKYPKILRMSSMDAPSLSLRDRPSMNKMVTHPQTAIIPKERAP